MTDKTACRTPAEGRDGVTNIPTWKFEAVRSAILEALSDGELPYSKLNEAVRARMDMGDLDRLGSLPWHVVSVKLELEVRGEVERIKGAKPQLLRKVIT